MSQNHADALKQAATALGKLAEVKAIVDQGGGDFGQRHKSLLITGRESVNDLIDTFINSMGEIRNDEIEKKKMARKQMGLFPDEDTEEVAASYRGQEPEGEPPHQNEVDADSDAGDPAAADGVYWQVLEHNESGERYAVQVRPSLDNPDSPEVFGFLKLDDTDELPAPESLPGMAYEDDPITIEVLNDPNEPFGVRVRFGEDTAAEPVAEEKPKKRGRKKKGE